MWCCRPDWCTLCPWSTTWGRACWRLFSQRHAWRWRFAIFKFRRRSHKWRNILSQRSRRRHQFSGRSLGHRLQRPASPARVVIAVRQRARKALSVSTTWRRRRPVDAGRLHRQRILAQPPKQNTGCNRPCDFHRNSPSLMTAERLSAHSIKRLTFPDTQPSGSQQLIPNLCPSQTV